MEYQTFIVLYGVLDTFEIAKHRAKFGWMVDKIAYQHVIMKRDIKTIAQEILSQEYAYNQALNKYIECEKKSRIDKDNLWIYLLLLFPGVIYMGYKLYQRKQMKFYLDEMLIIIQNSE